MSLIKTMVKLCVNTLLAPVGYEVRKKALEDKSKGPSRYVPDYKAGGFPEYLREANNVDMDVNDWEEQKLGWGSALPILEQVTFPYLREDSIVCELGVGTGRFARHIVAKLSKGELHLVDYSPWIVNFLREYFQSNTRIHVHLNDGQSLPFPDKSWIDLIFSASTFIALNLGLFHLYSQEFFRVLKPGGYCVLNYLDITTPQGWNHLEIHGKDFGGNCYTYHTMEVVDRVFSSVGFEIVIRHQRPNSTYLVVRKPGTV